MRDSQHLLLGPALVFLALGTGMAVAVASVGSATFSLLIYVLANSLVYADALDFLLRLHVHRRHVAASDSGPEKRDLSIGMAGAPPDGPLRLVAARPFAIVASVYNLERDLEAFIEAFAPYRAAVWIISDGSTDHTVKRLRQAGWRCIEESVNRGKPAALRRLLDRLPAHIETVMVVDPDVRIRDIGGGSAATLERVISDFQQTGAAALCPRIAIEQDGFLRRFQALEYAWTCHVGRKSLADYSVTSGVAVYRRDKLALALREHSLSIYAEDLENALILLSRGERIYYDGRLLLSTPGPGSLRHWFSQRVGWYYGFLKVYAERFSEVRRISRRAPFAMYNFIVYMGLLSVVWHVLRVLSAVLLAISFVGGLDYLFATNLVSRGTLTNPVYFVIALGKYVALGGAALYAAVPKAERAYVAPILPLHLFYVLAHVAPMSVGFGNWITLKLFGRRLYRDHYEPLESKVMQPANAWGRVRRVT